MTSAQNALAPEAPEPPVAAPSYAANPAPAGLVALAIAAFGFWAVLTGRVEHGATPYLACWLLGGFVVQFTVAVIELREHALTGGNVWLFFSAFFMLTTALKFLMGSQWGGQPIDARIDGYAWIVLSLILWLWSPVYFKFTPYVMSLVVLGLDIAAPLIAFTDLGILSKATWSPVAGWFLLLSGVAGIWVASATIVNAAFGKSVLPNPAPKSAAAH